MSEALLLAIQITIIGMSLVFGAILLLWIVMALLVRLSAEKAETDEEIIIVSSGQPSDHDNKKQAAAVAVAVALAHQADSSQPHPFPLPPTALVSAWQAVLRTRMVTKRGRSR